MHMFTKEEKQALLSLVNQLQFPASEESKKTMEMFLSIRKKLESEEPSSK